MMPDMNMLFNAKGQNVVIHKPDGSTISVVAAYNAKERHFTFRPDVEIEIDDIIVDSINGKYVVMSVEPKPMHGKIYAKYAHVITERECKEKNANRSDVYNIGTAVGSVIGSQTNAAITNNFSIDELRSLIENDARADEDREELQDLLNAINALIENNIPAQKSTLARFAELIQKNSWIASPVAALLLRWIAGI